MTRASRDGGPFICYIHVTKISRDSINKNRVYREEERKIDYMTDWFEWNGKKCTEYSIHVSEHPPITFPIEQTIFITVHVS